MRKKIPLELQKNLDRTEWTGNELLIAKLPEPEWVVPQLLPCGLTVLAGRPFAGKSFLALQLAGALRSGGMILGQQVKQGRVLYIAREDINSSLRKRMLGQRWGKTNPLYDVDIFTSWERFKKGGMEKLKKQLQSKEYVVVVLDSLYKFLSGSKSEKDGEMEPIMSELQDFYKRGLTESVFCLAHTNKTSVTQNDGGESSVSGDTALMGVSDNFWTLYQKQGNKQFFFHAEGRLMDKVDLEVSFDKTTLAWQVTTPKDKLKSDSVRGLMLTKFREQARPLSATVLSELTGKDIALIHRELKKLEDDQFIQRLPRAGVEVFYALKNEKPSFLHA